MGRDAHTHAHAHTHTHTHTHTPKCTCTHSQKRRENGNVKMQRRGVTKVTEQKADQPESNRRGLVQEERRRVLPQELGPCWPHLHQPAGQALPFHHGGRRGQLVLLCQSAGDPGGRGALPGRDDDAHPVVATASHRSSPSIHHEAH